MSLRSGTRLGPYEIVAALGAGGMGEVYRARDTRLGRDVAIKVLPSDVADDPERRVRFEREAKAVAALDHPHICGIYDVGEADGTHYLVMPLLDGPTLAAKLEKGALPIAEALTIAGEIADALDKAHRQGIVHRDLKPANVMLTKSGVKLLDFGLAKLRPSAGAVALSDAKSATTTAGTAEGTILGTIHYMAPEQVEGKEADHRADIWALGAVIYEMVTGLRPFPGDSAASIVGAILKDTPDALSRRQPVAPAALDRLVATCLSKDPEDRWQSARDLARELRTLPADVRAQSAASSARPRLWLLPFLGGAALAAAIVVAALRSTSSAPPTPLETRTDIATPPTDEPFHASFALSHDGGSIAYVAADTDGVARLWVRRLATTEASIIAGTDGALLPFWSPNGRSLAFFADGQLKRVELDGHAVRTLAPVAFARGGSWGPGGDMLFAATAGSAGPLSRVPAVGGTVTDATVVVGGQTAHRFPVFLPDGRRFLFYARGSEDATGIYLASVDGGTPTRLTPSLGAGVFVAPGWLVWVRGTTLVAQRLEVDRSALVGDVIPIAEGLANDAISQEVAISASRTGSIAYRVEGTSSRQLVWFDRAGNEVGTFAPKEAITATSRLALSPDGRRVAVYRTLQGDQDIWLADGVRASRFTAEPGTDMAPVWSPDGSRIAYRNQLRPGDILVKPTSGSGPSAVLVRSDDSKFPLDWSRDGRWLLYSSNSPNTGSDIWISPVAASDRTRPFVQSAFEERNGRFSPDGQWVAYQSNESGRPEIYLRSFHGADEGADTRVVGPVSAAGGVFPFWAKDGRELFFLASNGDLVSVAVSANGADVGAPLALFRPRVVGGGIDAGQGLQIEATSDRRFLINVVRDLAGEPIRFIQRWTPGTTK